MKIRNSYSPDHNWCVCGISHLFKKYYPVMWPGCLGRILSEDYSVKAAGFIKKLSSGSVHTRTAIQFYWILAKESFILLKLS